MKYFTPRALVLVSLALLPAAAQAQTAAPSKAETVLNAAAAQGRYTFLLFHRNADNATRSVAHTLSDGIARRADQATWAYVPITDPAEAALVKKYGVARAPMPLVVAVAPNGAITGVFQQRLEDASLDEAIVSPTMSRCMKAMQEGKLVLVCGFPSATGALPAGVKDMQADPHFSNRLTVIPMQLTDPAETRFVSQMELPANSRSTAIVFMAPPGVVVGKYNSLVTKNQMASDLHKAGKCCDDPDCPHNH